MEKVESRAQYKYPKTHIARAIPAMIATANSTFSIYSSFVISGPNASNRSLRKN